ncbi:MAG: response regulator [Proteobacteria bacterium]|nr:response regulator [Pseudomonadota bacterium]
MRSRAMGSTPSAPSHPTPARLSIPTGAAQTARASATTSGPLRKLLASAASSLIMAVQSSKARAQPWRFQSSPWNARVPPGINMDCKKKRLEGGVADNTGNLRSPAGFLTGDNEMARLIADRDWRDSLGPIHEWPASLKTTVGLMLRSPVPLVLLWGPDGIMLYNDAYGGFAGNRHPGILGQKVLAAWPEAADLNTRVMAVCMAGGTLQFKDERLVLNRRGSPEEGWMDLFYSPVIDESGRPGGVIAVVVETTERVLARRAAGHAAAVLEEAAAAREDLNATLEKRVEERTSQLHRAEEALRQSQKMEAVGQLTGGIAHDFNNLLQGITGALERAQRRIETGRNVEAERYIKIAVDSASRAAALTHRLLAFSRRQTLDPRPTDVNRLMVGMEDLIRRTMGPHVSVEVVQAGGLWAVHVDTSQLENSLLNLCINARDAMPDGGKLTIETANKWLDERSARERDLPPGQYVSLCVTDTGTGMTPDVIARAFDPFFTTKPLGRGTGLGLSMIYGFARQSGGQVRIYSEEGRGTTMCLYFPRYRGEIETEPQKPSELVERGFGETVLIVDDEEDIRMLIAEVLIESHYNVLEASDGASALEILATRQPVQLVVTDVGLPGGMNGRQLAEAARADRTNLKVLFITGYAENAALGSGYLEPGMEVLAKPFAMSTLANKVRHMLEG